MATLQKEIDQVVNNHFNLQFTVPTAEALQDIRRINRDRTAQEKGRIKKVEKNLDEILEMLREGVISADAIPQLQDIIKKVQESEPSQ